jgi:hypothetical protein
LHIRLAKTIALIDLFRNGTGIVAERDTIQASAADIEGRLVDRALDDLREWSVVIYRKHVEAWAIYAGSDFDIEAAVEAAKTAATDLNLRRLTTLAGLQPVLAKQHYTRTGALRWYETGLVPVSRLRDRMGERMLREGATGALFLAIPAALDTRHKALAVCRAVSAVDYGYALAIGFPWNADVIRNLGAELIALETVRETWPELEGDNVARREITARISEISAQLEEELRAGFADAIFT